MAKKQAGSTRELAGQPEVGPPDLQIPVREPVGGGEPWTERGRGAGQTEPATNARLSAITRSRGPLPALGPFPLDHLTYDLITILHEKPKGLEAFEQYLEDARDDHDLRLTLEDIREQDERAITELRDHLYRIIMQRRGMAA